MKSQKYYSRAKFLITGEYLVLKGAKALALPLKYGQTTEIFYNTISESFEFLSYENQKNWFKAIFNSNDLSIIETTEEDSAHFIQKVLLSIKKLKPNFEFNKIYKIENHIDFNRHWGLGTSSTLINNLAHWADINPFDLHFSMSNGSAYDIAAANANRPIVYTLNKQIPNYQSIIWKIPFKKQIFFVYLKNKQSSEKSVNKFQKIKIKTESIDKISQLTNKILNCNKIADFKDNIKLHEKIISKVLKAKTIQEKYFSDFDGQIKSLGAWGGDFCMVLSERSKNYIKNYFSNKGYDTLFNYSEIVYERNN